ncbi:hypothetical protein JL193_11680 [Polaribacter batillariae]|uniref:Lipoprotein n=1 Tax=Polaribacter batillariae TaxID=2808900 RepID=A0ABX7SRB4_9FLAO|nr:hypothetical protein [Polaribacter batillariae]QTD36789.1 hypothetical protein JL193_11680 [Polaribacter batillariae]
MRNPISLKIIIYNLFVLLFLSSCGSTYNVKSEAFQQELQNGNTQLALEKLDKNKFLKKDRNLLLYYLEKGKVAYLDNDYELSNTFLNKADDFILENKRDVGGKILGTLLNPEQEAYLGEDFEKVAIHYYKALNYTFLNKFDEALVEVRKINLQLQQINEKYPSDQKNRYTTDAFALSLQGMLYESSGNINDAFISYRNAVDLYLKNEGHYFGVDIPNQLKEDLLRTAKHLGFTNEFLRYKKLLNYDYTEKNNSNGEVIIFWENGLIPYKDENNFAFTILPGKETGIVTIYNKELNLNIPIPISNKKNKKNKFSDISVFNVAFPKYVARHPYFTDATIKKDSVETYHFQLAQNYEEIAFKTLKDRTLREIGKVALRLAVKKTSEYLVRDKNEDLGALLGIFNSITEGADTRNWQSLPQKIYYTRIPLQKGKNTFTIQLLKNGNTASEKKIEVTGTGNLVFRKISSLNSY